LKLRTAQALRASGETLERAADICGYSDSSALLHAMKNDKAR
jgi:AraC-like DNA-binding protein